MATGTSVEAVLSGATCEEVSEVRVVRRPALAATVSDVLDADGYLLGTPANIGYMSGALKHFFDTIYYPCLDATKGRPYALYVHGNLGTEGAIKAVSSITRLSSDPNKGMAGRCVQGLIDVLEGNYGGDVTKMPYVVNKEAFKK